MLTRLYIDNFRCFVNFEYRPARRQLILGRNGSGKSSMLDALLLLRQFAISGLKVDDLPLLGDRTRWMHQLQQTFEIEATLDRGLYRYRLVFEPWGDPPKMRVASETVHFNQRPIFEFTAGEVHLYNDRFEHKVTYPFDWHRSALATIVSGQDSQTLTRFRQWFGCLLCFRINPFKMGFRAEAENLSPNVDLSNFAEWYRALVQEYPKENSVLLGELSQALDGFSSLELKQAGENVRFLVAEFLQYGGTSVRFGFDELSDGQRCLICLYAILHFLLARGRTMVLDEPDNFVSLREIQPWLMAATDSVEDGQGQLLLISHHPEIINQWAPGNGVQFVRDGGGPVRVVEFRGDPDSSLSPSELIAGGWENG